MGVACSYSLAQVNLFCHFVPISRFQLVWSIYHPVRFSRNLSLYHFISLQLRFSSTSFLSNFIYQPLCFSPTSVFSHFVSHPLPFSHTLFLSPTSFLLHFLCLPILFSPTLFLSHLVSLPLRCSHTSFLSKVDSRATSFFLTSGQVSAERRMCLCTRLANVQHNGSFTFTGDSHFNRLFQHVSLARTEAEDGDL